MLYSAKATPPATRRPMRIAGPLVLAAGLAVTAALQQQDAGPGRVDGSGSRSRSEPR